MSEAHLRASKIAQWGSSAAVRLAAAALEAANLNIGDAVEVVARDDEIIIRRQRPRVTMAELLARFDASKHRHDVQLDVEPLGTETPSAAR